MISVCILILVIIFVLFKTSEDFVTSTEAVNNVASMYNASNLTATNITTTDTLNSKNINANVMQVIGPDGALWTNGWTIYANKIVGANGNDLHIYSGKKTTIHSGAGDNNTLEVGEFDGNRLPYVQISSDCWINGTITTRHIGANSMNVGSMSVDNITTRMPEISYTGAFENGALIDWASTTGCGGLMSKTMPVGTTKSFIIRYNNGNSLGNSTITLLESSGAFNWNITSWAGLRAATTPFGLSGVFKI